MTTHTILRRLASLTGAVLLGGTGVLAAAGTADALDVTYSSWDSGTNLLLDGGETSAAVAEANAYTSPLCADAIDLAIQQGISFPDRARSTCATAVVTCAKDARSRGNALSGTRMFADGGYRCLVR
jgi:hypothetical protein